jgi:hypothetical protein
MTFFLGSTGNIRIRRGSRAGFGTLADNISSADVNTVLNRLSFDAALDNLLTGDRVDITTADPRGLVCFTPACWTSGVVENTISAYVNVNAVGGLRFFSSFENAVNNVRAFEFVLTTFVGADLAINLGVRDVRSNILGGVTDYTLNTDREAIDTTTLSDKFRRNYAAGLISGSGTIECFFDYESTGVRETPLLMLQLVQRLDIGSEFDLALYLTDKDNDSGVKNVFYEMAASVTRAGVSVSSTEVITCRIDFVTTGEIRLLIGEPVGYVLKEDDDRIELEQSLEYLLQEAED